MSNQLASLRDITTVVADTGDIDAIKKYQPVDATTNPSLLLKAASLPQYASLIDDAVAWAKLQSNDSEQQLTDAADKLSVAIGKEISSTIPGRISTEVDARLSFDKAATIEKAERLVQLYEDAGVDKSRILIKMASTWEGIQAAEELEKKGIQCNLTLLFSFAQARACAEAGFSSFLLLWVVFLTGIRNLPVKQSTLPMKIQAWCLLPVFTTTIKNTVTKRL